MNGSGEGKAPLGDGRCWLTRVVLDPIPTTGLTTADVDELTRSTRELMLKELVALSAKAQKRPMAMPASNGRDGVVKASGADATLS